MTGRITTRMRVVPASPRFLVCVPTYDERENLERMVDALDGVREPDGASGEVLVIDDSSPDGTGELADALAAGRPWLHVLHRPHKQGLGRAYLDGFRWALARDYDFVLEMDCDFSHDPRAVPSLLAPARAGADLVLGSRYCAGGRVENWGRARRVISGAGCLYARTLLGVGVRDLTGGFKCFRRAVLEAIELDAVDAQGYQFQIEMTYRALLLGFEVVEVPITFADRVAGGSKMSRSIVFEAMRRVPLLRLQAVRGRLPRSAGVTSPRRLLDSSDAAAEPCDRHGRGRSRRRRRRRARALVLRGAPAARTARPGSGTGRRRRRCSCPSSTAAISPACARASTAGMPRRSCARRGDGLVLELDSLADGAHRVRIQASPSRVFGDSVDEAFTIHVDTHRPTLALDTVPSGLAVRERAQRPRRGGLDARAELPRHARRAASAQRARSRSTRSCPTGARP